MCRGGRATHTMVEGARRIVSRPDPCETLEMWSGATAWALVLPMLAVPVRCRLAPPHGERGPSAADAKQEAPANRVASPVADPPPVAGPAITLPDEVVVRAMSAGQAA